jgi:hypothetical protein
MIDPRSVPSTFGEYTVVVRGVPMESAPLIENIILGDEDDVVKAIYASEKLKDFFAENGTELLDFGGGEFGISVPMLVPVPVSLLRSIKLASGKTVGLRRAKRILALCKVTMETEPHY